MNRLVFLQNTYGWGARSLDNVPRGEWLDALEWSRTGARLRVLLGDPPDWDSCWNTTPEIGRGPSSVCAPRPDYVAALLKRYTPNVVVTCGSQAEKVLIPLWKGPLLAVPHPTYRVLTNALYEEARELLDDGFAGRLALRQRRGFVEREDLGDDHD